MVNNDTIYDNYYNFMNHDIEWLEETWDGDDEDAWIEYPPEVIHEDCFFVYVILLNETTCKVGICKPTLKHFSARFSECRRWNSSAIIYTVFYDHKTGEKALHKKLKEKQIERELFLFDNSTRILIDEYILHESWYSENGDSCNFKYCPSLKKSYNFRTEDEVYDYSRLQAVETYYQQKNLFSIDSPNFYFMNLDIDQLDDDDRLVCKLHNH